MNRSLSGAQKTRPFEVGGLRAIAFVAGGLVQQAIGAAVVVNPSFDVTDVDGNPATLFADDYTTGMGATILNQYRNNVPVNVAGWVSTTQDFTAGVENSGAVIAPNDRATAYLAKQGSFSQVLPGPTESGLYILSADVYRRSDREFNPFTMSLVDDTTGVPYSPISITNPTPDPGTFSVWRQIYIVPDSTHSLRIEFVGTGSANGTNIDHVSLVPEPSTLAGLGLGATSLALFRRKRQSS
jgi:PEP-CTERM motif